MERHMAEMAESRPRALEDMSAAHEHIMSLRNHRALDELSAMQGGRPVWEYESKFNEDLKTRVAPSITEIYARAVASAQHYEVAYQVNRDREAMPPPRAMSRDSYRGVSKSR
ncbi:hypothetical protein Scep_024301 [Stephania cephalantha]|uniref:Uncharacterized protein n=1 Tax=Stephania cephalantha TaxID=152367 RepID=A0AAP0EXG6_9MAGN